MGTSLGSFNVAVDNLVWNCGSLAAASLCAERGDPNTASVATVRRGPRSGSLLLELDIVSTVFSNGAGGHRADKQNFCDQDFQNSVWIMRFDHSGTFSSSNRISLRRQGYASECELY